MIIKMLKELERRIGEYSERIMYRIFKKLYSSCIRLLEDTAIHQGCMC